MKGLILCGGKGSRLKPLTDYLPKQLIPIANKPLIFNTIDLLLESGIREIGIVVNKENEGIFKECLKDRFELDLHFIIQESSKGIANAVLHAEEFIEDEKFIMILGDNSFQLGFKDFIDNFLNSNSNCRMLLKQIENPENFGVAYIVNGKIVKLEEKPKVAYSNVAITGLYGFDKTIFNACRKISVSSRGEYEITDAINWMLYNGYKVSHEILSGYWRDVGSHKELMEENINRLGSLEEKITGHIENSSISGKVILEKNAVIYNSIVRGPIIIGENSVIKYSFVGPYTSIGKGVNIEKANIECSIVLDDCHIKDIDTSIDFSIIGEGSMIVKERGLKRSNRFLIGKNNIIYMP